MDLFVLLHHNAHLRESILVNVFSTIEKAQEAGQKYLLEKDGYQQTPNWVQNPGQKAFEWKIGPAYALKIYPVILDG